MFSQKGWRPLICNFLAEVKLDEMHTNGVADSIDNWTVGLVNLVGEWGPSRKALSLFLRDATYNFLLRENFKLDLIEAELEVPLDGLVMKGLHTKDRSLPTPPSVKSLNAKTSSLYQASAAKIAAAQGISRVHLDIALWDGGSGGSKT
jgi:hypothetical protein